MIILVSVNGLIEHNYESTYPVIHNKKISSSFVNPKAPIHIVTGAGGAPALDTFGTYAPWTRKRVSRSTTYTGMADIISLRYRLAPGVMVV